MTHLFFVIDLLFNDIVPSGAPATDGAISTDGPLQATKL